MRAVLDEGVPRGLAQTLRIVGIQADPFDPVWKGLKNGELIARAGSAGHTVLVTNDRNMAFQQSLKGRMFAVVALPSNRRTIIMTRVDDIADTIRRAVPGRHGVMNMDGSRVSRADPVIDVLPPVSPFVT